MRYLIKQTPNTKLFIIDVRKGIGTIELPKKRHIMTLDQNRIKEITDQIVEEIHPKKIYLFGSHAKGTAGPQSDLDLMIIADMPGPKNKRSLAVRRIFPHRDFSLDVFVYHEDEFDEEKNIANTLSSIVAREGKLIYA